MGSLSLPLGVARAPIGPDRLHDLWGSLVSVSPCLLSVAHASRALASACTKRTPDFSPIGVRTALLAPPRTWQILRARYETFHLFLPPAALFVRGAICSRATSRSRHDLSVRIYRALFFHRLTLDTALVSWGFSCRTAAARDAGLHSRDLFLALWGYTYRMPINFTSTEIYVAPEPRQCADTAMLGPATRGTVTLDGFIEFCESL